MDANASCERRSHLHMISDRVLLFADLGEANSTFCYPYLPHASISLSPHIAVLSPTSSQLGGISISDYFSFSL
jgi:hypothetical protein